MKSFLCFFLREGPSAWNEIDYEKYLDDCQKNNINFTVFDMLINDSIWLNDESVRFNCVRMGLDSVPDLGVMFTSDIVEMCREGFVSVVSEDAIRNNLIAEGVIAKPPVPLYTQNGDRVIWKLKHKDF